MLHRILLFLPLLALLLACERNKETPDKDGRCGCPEDQFCTEQFVSLTLEVRDQNQNPLRLDKIVSTRTNGQSYEFKQEPYPGMELSPSYAFWDDGQFDNTRKSGETLVVKGFKDNQEIFRREFKVGHDCCHVIWLEGDRKVQVEVSQ